MSRALLDAAPRDAALRPWPWRRLDAAGWRSLAAGAGDLALLALWAEADGVRAVFRCGDGTIMPVAAPLTDGRYATLSRRWPEAAGFEAAIADLWGQKAESVAGTEKRLDHGVWPLSIPLAPAPGPAPMAADWPEFFAEAAGEQWPNGPAGPPFTPLEHWRFRLDGTRIAAAARRAGYGHKGQISLMRGKPARVAARFAARLAGEATVAHSIAFAAAAEAALGLTIPPRATALRAVMAELERIGTHLSDLADLLREAGAMRRAAATCDALATLRAALAVAFGHRLMMDVVVPGGVAADLDPARSETLLAALAGIEAWRARFSLPEAALAGRGVVRGAGVGLVARAGGQSEDARRSPGYPPYERLDFVAPTRLTGDALARAALRVAEIGLSVTLVRHLLATLPTGALSVALSHESGEGLGVTEGPAGEIWHFLAIRGGLIAEAFPCDPFWRNEAALIAAFSGAERGDWRLIRASFGAGAAGADL
ncbi:NADH-quinone oxidoreductase subunit D-related protein [Acidibrevibacterium fodinaquatile]|uniref:NADH-quinone oxidoreductase subunit D-related protein n=1 Tax=Acidibrevibacterium fodinaquatile TaxID=1969806 RepID=UPI000E0D0B87|nr:hypothetical protein [Acidibrevibacterium fodinaquatile]